jgi:phosphoribosylformylglycinamidine (FGAM) synthase PurS component
MQTVELTVELKIPDVTALTAANALRRRLGYQDTLIALNRADYYRLELNVDSEQAALDLTTEMAEQTNLFVNPNKHRFSVTAGAANAVASEGDGTQTINVLVTDPDSGKGSGVLGALQGRLGYGDRVADVTAGNLWILKLKAETHEQAEQMAHDIAVTLSREQGLLLNPHFQECQIW